MSIKIEEIQLGVILKTEKKTEHEEVYFHVHVVLGWDATKNMLCTRLRATGVIGWLSIADLDKDEFYIEREEEDKWVDCPDRMGIIFADGDLPNVRVKNSESGPYHYGVMAVIDNADCQRKPFLVKLEYDCFRQYEYCQIRESDLDKFK